MCACVNIILYIFFSSWIHGLQEDSSQYNVILVVHDMFGFSNVEEASTCSLMY